MLNVPHGVPAGRVVVVVAVVVVVVAAVVVVVAVFGSVTVPSVRTTDSRKILLLPTVGTLWYLTTTLSRLRFWVPAMAGSSTQVTYS